MGLRNLGRGRNPGARFEQPVELLGEQDGPPARALEAVLTEEFRLHLALRRGADERRIAAPGTDPAE